MASGQANYHQVHYILTGFGSLARVIANDVDDSTEVYKRFGTLAARNRLYYEAEPAELEALQDQYDLEDTVDGGKLDDMASDLSYHVRRNARNWHAFEEGAANGSNDDRWKKRMDLAMRIRSILKEYRKSVSLFCKVVAGKSAFDLDGPAASGMVAGWARRRF